MAIRTLDQIYAELGSQYNPLVETIRKKQADIPNAISTEEQTLKAQEQDYYDTTIQSDARRRGLGFSGIPLAERARYGATQFLPALARLRQSGKEQATSLEEAILNLEKERMTQARGFQQQDVDNDYRERVFQSQLAEAEKTRAAARSSAASLFGGSVGGASTPQSEPTPQDLMKQSLGEFLKRQYASGAGQRATRQQQDNWVRLWGRQMGINVDRPNDPDGIWAFYNSLYPYQQYNRQAPARNTPAVASTALKVSTLPQRRVVF